MKKLLLAILATTGFITAAQAQVTGNFSLTNDYRFRGVSQTLNAPAVQGGLDYAHSSGLYVGTWNSSVSSQIYPRGAGIESDVYAGFKKKVEGVTLDAGVYKYMYPRASGADTQELYVGAALHGLSVKVSQSTGNYFGIDNSKNSLYYQVDYARPVGGLTFVAHAGRTDVANRKATDYNDFNFGLVKAVKGLDVSARYYVNRSHNATWTQLNTVAGQQLGKDAFVVSLGKSF